MILAKSFQQEKFKREIDSCTDIEKLKEITKLLLQSYYTQKEMLEAEMRKSLGVDLSSTS